MAETPEVRPTEHNNREVLDLPTNNPSLPIVATAFNGLPTLGPILENGLRRALLGWTHKKDTPEGLQLGKLWCWVASGGKGGFQVYDAQLNRSPFPVGTGSGPNATGVDLLIDCGVANFGMVRMFHPWWCPNGRIPKDMNSSDKRMCRHRYRQLIKRIERDANRNRNRDKNQANSGVSRRRRRLSVEASESDDELLILRRRNVDGGSGRDRGHRGRPGGIRGLRRSFDRQRPNVSGMFGREAAKWNEGVNVERPKPANDGLGSIDKPVILDESDQANATAEITDNMREESSVEHGAESTGDDANQNVAEKSTEVEMGQIENAGMGGYTEVRAGEAIEDARKDEQE